MSNGLNAAEMAEACIEVWTDGGCTMPETIAEAIAMVHDDCTSQDLEVGPNGDVTDEWIHDVASRCMVALYGSDVEPSDTWSTWTDSAVRS